LAEAGGFAGNRLGYRVVPPAVTEIGKLDAGLACLSALEPAQLRCSAAGGFANTSGR